VAFVTDDPHLVATPLEWLVANRRLATLHAVAAAAEEQGQPLASKLGKMPTSAWQALTRMRPHRATAFAAAMSRVWRVGGTASCWFGSAMAPPMADAEACAVVHLMGEQVATAHTIRDAIECEFAATAAALVARVRAVSIVMEFVAMNLHCDARAALSPRQLVAYFRAFGVSRDAVLALFRLNSTHRGRTAASVRAWGCSVLAAAAWVRRGALVALRARLREREDAWTAVATAIPRLAAAAGAARLRARGIVLEP
jgi:hypothetical protein